MRSTIYVREWRSAFLNSRYYSDSTEANDVNKRKEKNFGVLVFFNSLRR